MKQMVSAPQGAQTSPSESELLRIPTIENRKKSMLLLKGKLIVLMKTEDCERFLRALTGMHRPFGNNLRDDLTITSADTQCDKNR